MRKTLDQLRDEDVEREARLRAIRAQERADHKVALELARDLVKARDGIEDAECETLEFPLLRALRRALPELSPEKRSQLVERALYGVDA